MATTCEGPKYPLPGIPTPRKEGRKERHVFIHALMDVGVGRECNIRMFPSFRVCSKCYTHFPSASHRSLNNPKIGRPSAAPCWGDCAEQTDLSINQQKKKTNPKTNLPFFFSLTIGMQQTKMVAVATVTSAAEV